MRTVSATGAAQTDADFRGARARIRHEGLALGLREGLEQPQGLAQPDQVTRTGGHVPVSKSSSPVPGQENEMDSKLVEELTSRLPTSELVKIIKGALECGRRNLPFTEQDLLRAMTFGSGTYARASKDRELERRPGQSTR